MISAILKWGVISGGLMIALFTVTDTFMPPHDAASYQASEIAGYIGILVSLGVIYLAIAAYFPNEAAPDSFWARAKLGLGVALVSGIIFGVYNLVYVTYINPTFVDDYFNYYLSQLPEQSGPAYEAQVKELEGQKTFFASPLMSFLVMGATVWLVGIPVSLISAFVHRRFGRIERCI